MIGFTFRSKRYCCDAFVDREEFPCYVFVILRDAELIAEFGQDITLKTDLQNLLPRKNDFPATALLHQTIFSALKTSAALQPPEPV